MDQTEVIDLSANVTEIRQHFANEAYPGCSVKIIAFGCGVTELRRAVMVLEPANGTPEFFDLTALGIRKGCQEAAEPAANFTSEAFQEWRERVLLLPGVKPLELKLPRRFCLAAI